MSPFLNNWVEYYEGTRFGFLGTLSLLTFCGYLFASAHRGNSKIGLRFFCVNFYPTLPRETFMNAFFANCLATNIWAFAVLQFSVQLFRNYLRGTNIAKIYEVQVKYLIGIGWFFQYNFFVVWTIVWWFLVFIYFVLKPYEKVYLGWGIKHSDVNSKH